MIIKESPNIKGEKSEENVHFVIDYRVVSTNLSLQKKHRKTDNRKSFPPHGMAKCYSILQKNIKQNKQYSISFF